MVLGLVCTGKLPVFTPVASYGFYLVLTGFPMVAVFCMILRLTGVALLGGRKAGRGNKYEGRGDFFGDEFCVASILTPRIRSPSFSVVQEIPGSRRWLEILRLIPMPMAVKTPPTHTSVITVGIRYGR